MFQEISDKLWKELVPILKPFERKHPGGSKPIGFRRILNGIFFQLKTGCQWDMIPRKYGSKSTIHEHFQRWARAGVFDKIFEMNLKEYDELKGIEWEWQSMDGTICQAPTNQKGGAKAAEEGLGRNPTDRGRSGTKIHLIVDKNGQPLGVEIVGANVHDSRLVGSTIESIIIERPEVTPEKPQNLCQDKGYDYERVEKEVKEHGYQPHIRRIGEEKQCKQTGEKKYSAKRWVVERTFAWMKGFRAIRTRYFCKSQNFLAMIMFALSLILFRASYA